MDSLPINESASATRLKRPAARLGLSPPARMQRDMPRVPRHLLALHCKPVPAARSAAPRSRFFATPPLRHSDGGPAAAPFPRHSRVRSECVRGNPGLPALGITRAGHPQSPAVDPITAAAHRHFH